MAVIIDDDLMGTRCVAVNPQMQPAANTTYDGKVGPRTILYVSGSQAPDKYVGLFEGIANLPGSDDPTLAHRMHAPTLQGPWTLESGPVVPGDKSWQNLEFAPTAMVRSMDKSTLVFFGHGGNVSGDKEIGMATARDLFAISAWTENPSNPVINRGAPTEWDEDDATDMDLKEDPNGPTRYRGLFRGRAGGESHGQTGLIYGDNLENLTKYASNPVISKGTGADADADGAFGAAWYRDSVDGRIHAWYVGDNGGVRGMLYAYSDDDGQTFNKGSKNPVMTDDATQTPDYAGDVLTVVPSGDTIAIWYGHGGSVTEEGVSMCVAPSKVDTPAIPARWYHPGGTWAYTSFSTSLTLLTRTEFTVVARFRCFAMDRNTPRHFYTEEGDANNKQTFFRIEGNASDGGQLHAFFRTPTTSVNLKSGASVFADTSDWMRAAFVRVATDSFELWMRNETQGGAWVKVDSDAVTDPGTTTPTNFIAAGNWHASTAFASNQPLRGTMAVLKTIDTALTSTEFDDAIDEVGLPGGATEILDLYDDGTDTGDTYVVDATIPEPLKLPPRRRSDIPGASFSRGAV